MPQNYKKRNKKRKGHDYNPSYQMYRQPQGEIAGIPLKRTAMVRWNDVYQIASTGGILEEFAFRANGPWDPQNTVGGSGPLALQTFKNIYNHMVCLKSRIRIRWTRPAGATTVVTPIYAGVTLDDSGGTLFTQAREIIESRKGQYVIVDYQDSHNDTHTSFDAKKFFNITDPNDNIDRIGSTTQGTPTEEAYYIAWLETIGTGSQTLTMDVTIDYIIEFSEPKDMTVA